MFEVLGYFVLKLCGFGWLWQKEAAKDVDANSVFGDGSIFLIVGFVSMILAMFLVFLLCLIFKVEP